MALRYRLMLMVAAAVGVATVLAAVVAYAAVRNELRGQVDDTLRDQARLVSRVTDRIPGTPPDGAGSPFGPGPPPGVEGGQLPRRFRLPGPPDDEGPTPSVQLVGPDGNVLTARGPRVDAGERAAALATRGEGRVIEDRDVDGRHMRVLTEAVEPGLAVQVARSLDSTDDVLSRLRVILALLAAGGVLVAVLLARALAKTVIRPLSRLEAAADHVTETEDLTRRIDATGDDEIGRLARRFNAMLDTLEGSQRALGDSVTAQRQLVADASHELRTPVTSLRTNLEVLQAETLPEAERGRVLVEAVGQTEELTALIADVIDLARGDAPADEPQDVRLDELVAEAVERGRRHAPAVAFETTLEPVAIQGIPDRLARAVNNLLDNAVSHGPPAGPVEVTVTADGAVTVRDHGDGVPAEEAEHVFDRFYRGNGARERPGSGLGLAIVRQVAETHGGEVSVEDAPGGGASFRLRLPVANGSAAGEHVAVDA